MRFAAFLVLLTFLQTAFALPAATRQTGLSCGSCHEVAPELLEAGREFKISAYHEKRNDAVWFPISLQAYLSYTSINLPSTEYPSGYLSLPHYQSIHYLGRIVGNFGANVSVAYEDGKSDAGLAPSELRYAKRTVMNNQDIVMGAIVTNKIGFQDPWNTSLGKTFPYRPRAISPSPTVKFAFAKPFDQPVYGGGLYAYINSSMYFEVSGFRSDPVVSRKYIRYMAPYWRALVNHHEGDNAISIGMTQISSDIVDDASTVNSIQKYGERALDFNYQYNGRINQFGVQAGWVIHDVRYRDTALGRNVITTSNVYRAFVSYSMYHALGFKIGVENTSGETDATWYAEYSNNTSIVGNPRTNLILAEIIYYPIRYVRVSTDFYIYDYFNGAQKDYDGNGRNARDNDTIFLSIGLIL